MVPLVHPSARLGSVELHTIVLTPIMLKDLSPFTLQLLKLNSSLEFISLWACSAKLHGRTTAGWTMEGASPWVRELMSQKRDLNRVFRKGGAVFDGNNRMYNHPSQVFPDTAFDKTNPWVKMVKPGFCGNKKAFKGMKSSCPPCCSLEFISLRACSAKLHGRTTAGRTMEGASPWVRELMSQKRIVLNSVCGDVTATADRTIADLVRFRDLNRVLHFSDPAENPDDRLRSIRWIVDYLNWNLSSLPCVCGYVPNKQNGRCACIHKLCTSASWGKLAQVRVSFHISRYCMVKPGFCGNKKAFKAGEELMPSMVWEYRSHYHNVDVVDQYSSRVIGLLSSLVLMKHGPSILLYTNDPFLETLPAC
ncbi:hypothetical protein Pelo_5366 [Pelomyxa schiedti]|nr:hypothetical protein Pelo_5366 [Pelomyxa schiedti]